MERLKMFKHMFLAMILCISIGAVSMPEVQAKELTNPREIVMQSAKKAYELNNYQITSKVNVKMDGVLEMRIAQDITIFKDPSKMKVTSAFYMKSGNKKGENTKQEMYFINEGKKYLLYAKVNNKWTKYQITEKQYLDKMTEVNLLGVNDNINYKMISNNEMIDGKEAYLIEYTLTEETMKEYIEMMGMSVDDLKADWSKDVRLGKFRYWIEKKTLYPIKCTMDMSDMMKVLMEISGLKVGNVKFVMEASYKNIDNAKDFTLPQGAKLVK